MVNHMYKHCQIAQIGQHELQAFVDLYFYNIDTTLRAL